MSSTFFPEMSLMSEWPDGQYSNHYNFRDYDMPITSQFPWIPPRITTAHTSKTPISLCSEIMHSENNYQNRGDYSSEILRLDEENSALQSDIRSKDFEIEELKQNHKYCRDSISDLQYEVRYLTERNTDLRKDMREQEADFKKQSHEYNIKRDTFHNIEKTLMQLLHEHSTYIKELHSEINILKTQLLEKDTIICEYEHIEKNDYYFVHSTVGRPTSFWKGCETELQRKYMLLQTEHVGDLKEKDSKIKALTNALSQERMKYNDIKQECMRDKTKFSTPIAGGRTGRKNVNLDLCSDLLESRSTESDCKQESNFTSPNNLTETTIKTTKDNATIKQQINQLNKMKEYLAEKSKRIDDLECKNQGLMDEINLKIQHIKTLEGEMLLTDSEISELKEDINKLNIEGTTGVNQAQHLLNEISDLKLTIVNKEKECKTLQVKLYRCKYKNEELQGKIKLQHSTSMELEQEKCDLLKQLDLLKYQPEKKDNRLEQLKLIKAHENKIESLSNQIENLSIENEKCKTSNGKLMNGILSLRNQIKKVTLENTDNKDIIKHEMNELKKMKEYVLEKNKLIADLETKNKDLLVDINFKIEDMKTLEHEISDLTEEKNKLKKEGTTGVNHAQYLQAELSVLQLTIVKNEEENKTLQLQLNTLEQEKCNLQKELDKYQTGTKCKNLEQLMVIKARETKIESLSTQIKNLSTENEKCKASNVKLLNDINSLQKQIKENEKDTQSCMQHISDLVVDSEKNKAISDQFMKENTSLRKRRESEIKENALITNFKDEAKALSLQYKDEISLLKKEHDATIISMEQLKDENNVARQALMAKDHKIEDLSNRLATEMSMKVSADECSLENVSEKNRPMNIAAEYEMICSNQWHDAKEVLDNTCTKVSNDEKIEMLCSVFTISLSEAKKCEELLMSQIEQMLISPLHGSKYDSGATQEKRQHMPMPLRLLIVDIMRANADSVDLTTIISEVNQSISTMSKHIPPSSVDDPEVQIFVEASVRLAWKMVLQKPPMYFDKSGINESWKGDNKQDPFWGSSDPHDKKSKVKYFVHPAVYHGQSLMVKGRVYLSQ